MGSVSLKISDGTARFRRTTLCSFALHLLMLASIISTNLFALYVFTSSPSPSTSVFATAGGAHKNLSIIFEHVSLILREIEASERRLHQIERKLADYDTLDPTKPGLQSELKLILAHHPLPLGRDSHSGITAMVSSVAHSCTRPAAAALLSDFMSYRLAPCPTTDPLLPSKRISENRMKIGIWEYGIGDSAIRGIGLMSRSID